MWTNAVALGRVVRDYTETAPKENPDEVQLDNVGVGALRLSPLLYSALREWRAAQTTQSTDETRRRAEEREALRNAINEARLYDSLLFRGALGATFDLSDVTAANNTGWNPIGLHGTPFNRRESDLIAAWLDKASVSDALLNQPLYRVTIAPKTLNDNDTEIPLDVTLGLFLVYYFLLEPTLALGGVFQTVTALHGLVTVRVTLIDRQTSAQTIENAFYDIHIEIVLNANDSNKTTATLVLTNAIVPKERTKENPNALVYDRNKRGVGASVAASVWWLNRLKQNYDDTSLTQAFTDFTRTAMQAIVAVFSTPDTRATSVLSYVHPSMHSLLWTIVQVVELDATGIKYDVASSSAFNQSYGIRVCGVRADGAVDVLQSALDLDTQFLTNEERAPIYVHDDYVFIQPAGLAWYEPEVTLKRIQRTSDADSLWSPTITNPRRTPTMHLINAVWVDGDIQRAIETVQKQRTNARHAYALRLCLVDTAADDNATSRAQYALPLLLGVNANQSVVVEPFSALNEDNGSSGSADKVTAALDAFGSQLAIPSLTAFAVAAKSLSIRYTRDVSLWLIPDTMAGRTTVGFELFATSNEDAVKTGRSWVYTLLSDWKRDRSYAYPFVQDAQQRLINALPFTGSKEPFGSLQTVLMCGAALHATALNRIAERALVGETRAEEALGFLDLVKQIIREQSANIFNMVDQDYEQQLVALYCAWHGAAMREPLDTITANLKLPKDVYGQASQCSLLHLIADASTTAADPLTAFAKLKNDSTKPLQERSKAVQQEWQRTADSSVRRKALEDHVFSAETLDQTLVGTLVLNASDVKRLMTIPPSSANTADTVKETQLTLRDCFFALVVPQCLYWHKRDELRMLVVDETDGVVRHVPISESMQQGLIDMGMITENSTGAGRGSFDIFSISWDKNKYALVKPFVDEFLNTARQPSRSVFLPVMPEACWFVTLASSLNLAVMQYVPFNSAVVDNTPLGRDGMLQLAKLRSLPTPIRALVNSDAVVESAGKAELGKADTDTDMRMMEQDSIRVSFFRCRYSTADDNTYMSRDSTFRNVAFLPRWTQKSRTQTADLSCIVLQHNPLLGTSASVNQQSQRAKFVQYLGRLPCNSNIMPVEAMPWRRDDYARYTGGQTEPAVLPATLNADESVDAFGSLFLRYYAELHRIIRNSADDTDVHSLPPTFQNAYSFEPKPDDVDMYGVKKYYAPIIGVPTRQWSGVKTFVDGNEEKYHSLASHSASFIAKLLCNDGLQPTADFDLSTGAQALQKADNTFRSASFPTQVVDENTAVANILSNTEPIVDVFAQLGGKNYPQVSAFDKWYKKRDQGVATMEDSSDSDQVLISEDDLTPPSSPTQRPSTPPPSVVTPPPITPPPPVVTPPPVTTPPPVVTPPPVATPPPVVTSPPVTTPPPVVTPPPVTTPPPVVTPPPVTTSAPNQSTSGSKPSDSPVPMQAPTPQTPSQTPPPVSPGIVTVPNPSNAPVSMPSTTPPTVPSGPSMIPTLPNVPPIATNVTSTPPTQTGGPPTQTGGPPTQTGGPPTQTGGPPTQTGGPPTQTGGPSTQTGGPPPQTGGPSTQTGGPSTQTGGPPPQTSGPPTQTGGPPPQTSGPPTQTGGPSTQTGGPSTQTGGPSTQSGGPPTQSGGPPTQSGGQPSGTTAPPVQFVPPALRPNAAQQQLVSSLGQFLLSFAPSGPPVAWDELMQVDAAYHRDMVTRYTQFVQEYYEAQKPNARVPQPAMLQQAVEEDLPKSSEDILLEALRQEMDQYEQQRTLERQEYLRLIAKPNNQYERIKEEKRKLQERQVRLNPREFPAFM